MHINDLRSELAAAKARIDLLRGYMRAIRVLAANGSEVHAIAEQALAPAAEPESLRAKGG